MRGAFFRVATRLYRLTLRALGASTVGVRGIVVREDGAVLLVRHSYRPGWYLPGGGVAAGETAHAALLRELREEAGITVEGEATLFGVYFHRFMGVNDYPVVYVVRAFTQGPYNCPEIAEHGWFAPDALPANTTAGTRRRLEEFAGRAAKDERW